MKKFDEEDRQEINQEEDEEEIYCFCSVYVFYGISTLSGVSNSEI